MSIIRDRPAGFLVISGDDALTLPLIAAGADGVISVVANAYPKHFSEMVRLSIRHEMKKAQQLHYDLLPLIPLLFAEGSPSGVKCALKHLEICEEFVRMPLANISKTLAGKIISFCDNL